MKLQKLTIMILCFEVTLEAYKISFPRADTNQKNILMSAFPNQSQMIIIIDEEESGNPEFKSSVIGAVSLFHEQTYIILNVDTIPHNVSETKLREVINRIPNYLILINAFDSPIFNDRQLETILFSKWSSLHIVLSIDDEKYKCKDGTFDKNILKKSEILLNNVWLKFQIVYVTLSLPYLCFDHYLTYDKKKESGSQLYNRTIKVIAKELHQYPTKLREDYQHLSVGFPLKANIFFRFPTAIRYCDNLDNFLPPKPHLSDGFCGMDGIVLWNMAEHFGFKLNFVGEEFFGYMENGSYYGSLKNVVDGDVHVSFNARFMVPFGRRVKFLKFVDSDCLCTIVRRPEDRPIWLFPVEAYKQNVWIVVFTMLIFSGVFVWFKLHVRKYLGLAAFKIRNIFCYIEESLISGLLGFFVRRRVATCFVRGICLLCSIIISATFQGHVNFVFTTIIRLAPVNTLHDVLTLGYTIYTSPGIKTLIEPPLNEMQEELVARRLKLRLFDTVNDSLATRNEFEPLFKHANSATLRRQTDFVLETSRSFSDGNGEPLLSLVNECFRCYYLSYISTTGFLFEEHLKVFVERLVEAGLPKKYYEWTTHSLRLAGSSHHSSHRPRPSAKVELGDLRIVFGILTIGYAVSVAVFVCEIYWVQRHRF